MITHQDACSSFTDPLSCVTFWYALQDSTVENGCFRVARGSHRMLPIVKGCVRAEDGRAAFVDLATPVYADVPGESDPALPKQDDNDELVLEPVEVPAGTLVLMHGNLAHGSGADASGKGRLAFNFAVVEGEREWKPDAYLQPGEGRAEFDRLVAL